MSVTLDASKGVSNSAKRIIHSAADNVPMPRVVADSAKKNISKEESLEDKLIQEVCAMYSQGIFFYSDYDLTNSLERSKDGASYDQRFLWNKHLLKPFDAVDPNTLTHLVQGFVQIEPCRLSGVEFQYIVISRRSCERGGLRYERRGCDNEGNAANFVEVPSIPSDNGLDGAVTIDQ